MADSSTRIVSIAIPAAVKALNDAYSSLPDVLQLAIVADEKISGGKRAIQRTYRDANSDDPGRRQRVEWNIWGPIGASLESTAGFLGLDWCQGLESRWERRLTSAGKQNFLDLTTMDPPATEDALFGDFLFGDVDAPFGSPIAGSDVTVFAEQQGYLLVVRGRLLTQVDTTTTPWTVVSTTVLPAEARDADHWRGTVKIAEGPTAAMQRVIGASSSGLSIEDVVATSPAETVYASAIKRGSDRAWYVNANQSQSSYNFAGFTLDDFANLASPFQVGDPDVGTTGIGPIGPFTQFGQLDQISSFTDQGKPIPQSRALTSVHSALNGKQFADPGWSWNYYTSIAGLRANAGGTDNPVGIGERLRGFTGHNGLAYALYQVRGELPLAYKTTGGDIYGYRCTFGPQTGGSGQPLLFPWFFDDEDNCTAIYSSTTGVPDEQGIWIIRAKGTNLTYELIAANGRDDLYPSYDYSSDGGTAFLTTHDRTPNLLKTFRVARLRARNMGASGNSWALGIAFDPDPTDSASASYVTIDTVTTNGAHTLTATNGGDDAQGNPTPTANISGRTFKPRLVQVAGGASAESSPPSLEGTLEIEYDERPEQIEDTEVAINITATGYSDNLIWSLLGDLVGQNSSGPVAIQLPDDAAGGISAASGGGQKYAMVAGVTARQDISDNTIQSLTLRLQTWPQSAALS